MVGVIMSLSESIKNKYTQVKSTLKAAIFSKNKSIIRISEFSKKSTFSKILTFSTVNMLVVIPYIFWFSATGKLMFGLPLVLIFFAFSLFFANLLFFGGLKLISSIINLFKKKKDNALDFNASKNEPTKEEPQYYENTFMGKIKEFFIATGSIATSFLPFILMTNFAFISYYFHNFNYLNIDISFLANPLNYLRIDSVILIFMTTLATGSVYGIRFLAFLKRVLFRAKAAQENQEVYHNNAEPYKAKRAIPSEEFIPSLSAEFKKTHEIHAYEEMKSPQEIKKS